MNSIKLVFFIYWTMEKNMHRYFLLDVTINEDVVICIIKYSIVYALKHVFRLILKQLLKI